MTEERKQDPQADDVRAQGSDADSAEDDDTAGQVQSATWKTSTFKSSRSFTEVPGKAHTIPKTGSGKRNDQNGQQPESDPG